MADRPETAERPAPPTASAAPSTRAAAKPAATPKPAAPAKPMNAPKPAATSKPATTPKPAPATPAATRRPELPSSAFLEMLELFFFAYRDFVADPDAILARIGLGRAHHRVLHFVDRNPGLSVAELLDILKITKQSLARVLKELIETGHIESRTGSADRRQRLLYATDQGHALARSLSLPQIGRIAAAFQALGPDGAARAREFLRLMIDADERPRVSRYTNRPDTSR